MTQKQLQDLGRDMMEIESECSPNIGSRWKTVEMNICNDSNCPLSVTHYEGESPDCIKVSAKVKLYSQILDEIEKLSKWIYDNAAILPFSGSKVGPTKVVTTPTYGYGEQKLREGIRDIISKLSI